MDNFEISEALDNLTVLIDTREQETPALKKRIALMGRPYKRQKLDFGDYSAMCEIDGKQYDFSSVLAVERKMSLDEICNCFCRGRGRFTREFERAAKSGAKIYLLIEDGSWEAAYSGKYRSQMSSKAFTASLLAWLARYNCQLIFCKAETSGKLIADILYREAKERLEGMADE